MDIRTMIGQRICAGKRMEIVAWQYQTLALDAFLRLLRKEGAAG